MSSIYVLCIKCSKLIVKKLYGNLHTVDMHMICTPGLYERDMNPLEVHKVGMRLQFENKLEEKNTVIWAHYAEYEHFCDVLQPIEKFPQKSFIFNRPDMLPSPPAVLKGKRSYIILKQIVYIMIMSLPI